MSSNFPDLMLFTTHHSLCEEDGKMKLNEKSAIRKAKFPAVREG